jgi:hypothetical protein
MNAPRIVAEKIVSPNSQSEADTQLHGYKLMLARTAWAIIAVVAVAFWIADISPGYAQMSTVCTQSLCQNQQATPAMVRVLHSAGLSLQFYAIFLMTFATVAVLVFVGVGVIIAWRRSRDWMALLVSLTLIIIGTGTFASFQQLAVIFPFATALGDLLQFLLVTLPLLVGYLFPNGRFVPRWTRWLFLLVVLIEGIGTLFPSSPFNVSSLPSPLGIVGPLMLIGTILFAQVYRYLRVSTPVQRQQTKWIVMGITALIIYFVVLIVANALNPELTQATSLGSLFAETSYFLAVIIVPLAIALSILRYRLYDIDILINKALVYGLLTGILAALYVGLIIGLESLVRAITGQASQQPVVIVVSTLAIAALFQPLRRRIQHVIDRRFYRSKYDAAKTVAAFSATLRQEVDLDQLREQLLAVVQETMQPAHISLWLRQPERHTGESPPRLEQEGQAPPNLSGG